MFLLSLNTLEQILLLVAFNMYTSGHINEHRSVNGNLKSKLNQE